MDAPFRIICLEEVNSLDNSKGQKKLYLKWANVKDFRLLALGIQFNKLKENDPLKNVLRSRDK